MVVKSFIVQARHNIVDSPNKEQSRIRRQSLVYVREGARASLCDS